MFDCHGNEQVSNSRAGSLTAWWTTDTQHAMTSWLSYTLCLPTKSHLTYVTALNFSHSVCGLDGASGGQEACHIVYSTRVSICDSPAICIQQIATTGCLSGKRQLQCPFFPRDATRAHSTVAQLVEHGSGASLYSMCSPRALRR